MVMTGHPETVLILVVIWMESTIGPVVSSIQYTRETMPGAQYYDGKKLNIPITAEAATEMYERWVHQGISSIMSSVASQHLHKLNEYERNRVFKCSKAADDIYKQAKCVVRAIDAKPKPTKISRVEKLRKLLAGRLEGIIGALIHPETQQTLTLTEKTEYRTRRSVTNRYNYKLHTEYEHLTPFGIMGKYLSKMTKIFKNKDPKLSWEVAMNDIESMQKRTQAKERMGEELKKRFLFGQGNKKFKPKLTSGEKRLAKELRIPDTALGGMDQNDVGTKKILEFVRLFQRAVKLAMVIDGANGTELANKTLKFASPRLLSLVPDDVREEINVMSPSLFSIHDKGKGLEALTSIPQLLKTVDNKDYQHWLDFIVEASGATDAVNKMQAGSNMTDQRVPGWMLPCTKVMDDISVEEKAYPKFETTTKADTLPPGFASMPRGIDGQPMYFTKDNLTETDPESVRKVDIFEKLTHSLTQKQLGEFNITGFSVMNPEQLTMVYGPESPFNNSKTLDFFLSLSENDMRHRLLQNIRDIAKMRSSLNIRRKRAGPVFSPVFLRAEVFNPGGVSLPLIVSPIVLTLLLFSPAIFGAAIVSPWLFIAVIISPRLMCPLVLSPVTLSTLVLSPIALTPAILTPAVIVPFVLSPYVLSPNILAPGVLSPSILTPFALSPNIFSPVAFTALVGSPFVLSPSIFSPAYFAALIFSPNAFSPLINSTGKGVTLLFSPSLLS